MSELVSQMGTIKGNMRNNVAKMVSCLTSKKFAFLTAGKNFRNYETVIGLANKQLKVCIDSNGDLSVEKLTKESNQDDSR
jgi:hypothetical protein